MGKLVVFSSAPALSHIFSTVLPGLISMFRLILTIAKARIIPSKTNLFQATFFITLSSSTSSSTGADLEEGKHQPHIYHALQTKENLDVNASKEPMVGEISDLFKDLKDEAYDLIANYYDQLSDEIRSAILCVNPDLNEESLAYVRGAFMDFIKEDNDIPYKSPETSLPYELPPGALGEDAYEGGKIFDNDGNFESHVDAALAEDSSRVSGFSNRQYGRGSTIPTHESDCFVKKQYSITYRRSHETGSDFVSGIYQKGCLI